VRSRVTAASVSSVGTSPAAGHHHVGIIIGCPLPHAHPDGAVRDRLVDGEPLRGRLLAGDDEVDVIFGAQAVVGDGKQRVGVGRQIDAHYRGLLVD